MQTNTSLSKAAIERTVLDAIKAINPARQSQDQIPEAADAMLYAPGSPLDSMGLVSLLMEVEERLLDRGVTVSLSDERAMSQKNSPFRDVPTLVNYIHESLKTPIL